MAIFIKVFELIRKLVISINFIIACAMGYLFYLFLSQDGVFDGWAWLLFLPIYAAIFLGPPILMCISLLKDSSAILKFIFLTLNIFALIILLGGLFVNNWVMAGPELPFSWRSYIKISLILAIPFIANVMVLGWLLFQKRFYRP